MFLYLKDLVGVLKIRNSFITNEWDLNPGTSGRPSALILDVTRHVQKFHVHQHDAIN